MENEQISLPSLIVIVVLGALIIRYLFFSPAVSTQHQRGQRPNQQHQQDVAASASRAREAVVERIQQMFPQVERRTVLWDLQRNGGNIAATTERILAGRLETPPARFQPPPPPPSATSASSTAASSGSQPSSSKTPSKPAEPDLITRYKLQDRISAECAQQSEAKAKGAKGWSSNRDERQATLQRRRDEMILAARRRMEAKIAEEKTSS
ncbi:putative cue domain-containing protein [Eutypa lata UCREL1]|uniref:Coupling of ubiquitin conjugation to ER degradation protein 1 n=1 Tax=Eutypa lata (strain UCR-EL1) TaxID=1287681 RepID=M7SRI5_EUTLA|nr:putative cue domain-containing protein [Eutypa lata UCREL1]